MKDSNPWAGGTLPVDSLQMLEGGSLMDTAVLNPGGWCGLEVGLAF